LSLDQYRTAAFKQATLVQQEYLYKPDLANGICFALLVEWMKLTPLFGADGQDPATRMNTLNENFKLAGSRHLVSKSAYADTKQQDHADQVKDLWSSQASQEYAQLLTDLGKHSGLAFKFMRELAQADSLPQIVSHQAAKGRGFYLSIKFAAGGGHAIGFIPGSPQNPQFPINRLFDPNDGEFAFSDQQAKAFVDDLWDAYANIRGGITRYILYAITQQETLQEKWESGKLAQGVLPVSPVAAPSKLDPARGAAWESGSLDQNILPTSPQPSPAKLDPNRFANWQKKL
jgi:hypothetical protein